MAEKKEVDPGLTIKQAVDKYGEELTRKFVNLGVKRHEKVAAAKAINTEISSEVRELRKDKTMRQEFLAWSKQKKAAKAATAGAKK